MALYEPQAADRTMARSSQSPPVPTARTCKYRKRVRQRQHLLLWGAFLLSEHQAARA